MCGFCGIKYWNIQQPRNTIEKLFDQVLHRGKDAKGLVEADSFALGMCQLKTRGVVQEMPVKIENFYYGYNGEIYGGYIPNETIPSTIEEELSLLFKETQVNGMFSAVRLNEQNNQIHLIRDRFGQLPFYYLKTIEKVIFGSDIGVCLKNGKGKPNLQGLHEMLTLGKTLDNSTVYQDIYEVPPGTNQSFTGVDFSFEKNDLNFSRLKPSKKLLYYLKDSISRCSYTNEKIGVALSGGLDSSIIYEIMMKQKKGFESFSIITNGDGCLFPNHSTANNLKPKHHYVIYDKDTFLNDVHELVDIFKEPITLSSSVPILQLARLIGGEKIKVLITGEGADELYLGYKSYKSLNFKKSNEDLIYHFYLADNKRYWYEKIFGKESIKRISSKFRQEISQTRPYEIDRRFRKFEIKYSLNPLLKRNDRIFLYHGIESRTPFLHSLVPEYAFYKRSDELMGKKPLVSLYESLQNRRLSPKKSPLRLSFSMKEYSMVKMISYILDHESDLKHLGLRKQGVEEYCKKKENDNYYLILKIYTTLLWQKKFIN